MPSVVVPSFYILAGIMAYAALYHFTVGGSTHDRVHLLFAGMCLAAVPFAICIALALQATDIREAVWALKGRLAALTVFFMLFPWFIALYTGKRPLLLLVGLSLLFASRFIANLIEPYSLQYDHIDGLRHLHLPWGEVVTYVQGHTSLSSYFSIAGVVIAFGFAVYAVGGEYRRRRRRSDLAMLVAIGIFLLTAVQGILVRLGIFDSIRLGAFGFLMLVLVMSISLAYETQQRLRTSERHFRSLFENSPAAMVAIDPVSGRIVQANAIALQMSGYSAEELLTKTVADLTMPEDRQEGEQRFARLAAGTVDRLHYERRYRRKDGSSLMADHSVSSLKDRNGRVLSLIVSATDVSERKRAEEEREQLQLQLQQMQKLDSIGRLAGGVAHDFNNMLSVIIGYAELALRDMGPGHELAEPLREIHNAANRSAELTRQLLIFARKQAATPRVLDLNQAVEGTLKMLGRMIGEDIELVWQAGKDVWPIEADPSQLDQILANLCVNARDAIQGAGRITIETHNSTLDAAYCSHHLQATPGDYVRLAVSDNGCGMDGNTLGMIFEPFFTTKGLGEGTGLGLSTVYGIVEQNKGFIDVDSEPGRGTTFNIYLPRHAGAPGHTGKSTSDATLAHGHEQILLVEDEATILAVVSTILERYGYRMLAASTPEEAMRAASEHDGEIQLLITDMVLPGTNGRDLADSLLSLHPEMACLFMSGYSENTIQHRGMPDRDIHFIQKPFSMADLTAKVRQVLDG